MSFAWWMLRYYVPLSALSMFRSRPPAIVAFPPSSSLVNRLRSINALRPTRMCRVMRWYGSDKGNWVWHNYTIVYSALFTPLSGEPLRIFELGLGSNNPEFGANMGVHGRPGASLRGWRDLFPNAAVFGADIDRRILFSEERIATFYCDQLDKTAIENLWTDPALRDGMDIIVEDGLHTLDASVCFLESSLDRVRPGGIYVVEDVRNQHKQSWLELLEKTYAARYPAYEFAFVELPGADNTYDNNLLVIHRKQ